MKKQIIFFAVILLASTSCNTLKPLEYRSLDNFSVTKISETPEVTFDLKLYNPNTIGAKLKNFNLVVMMNDMKLTEIHLPEVVHAGAQSEFSIPISITTSISQLSQFIPYSISSFNAGKTIPVKMDGSITMKKFLFHKTFQLHFTESLDTKKLK